MTKGPGQGSRPGHGRYNPKPGQRGTKATTGVRSQGTGRGTTHKSGGGGQKPPARGCCPMVAALRSARAGRWVLARRYFRMSVRLLAGA
jgi:hypothetical protein